ncbi:hypothetical protein [Streptomyces sp. NPDC002763]|uniref:hypothetical protein n=1 Tax=Streptomyces sp. NPDC002763 TaxID=3154427 RepID=UPI00332C6F51
MPSWLITNSRTVHGHPSGDVMDVEDTLAFAALHGIRARFRMVLTTGARPGHGQQRRGSVVIDAAAALP